VNHRAQQQRNERPASDGRLIERPIEDSGFSLDALLAVITAENVHAEVDTGTAEGDEAW
jgi:antitoxin component of MazEF toxin-antitoxin module